jgi:ABC-type nitrate/sulfonate/bicarbonate transport system ATPase subunit
MMQLKRHLADFTGPCLLVTHDPLEALVLADRLIVLEGAASSRKAHRRRSPVSPLPTMSQDSSA